MNNIKVLIADDHTIVRIGLSALLGTQKDIFVVGEARNGEEAVNKSLLLCPDIVVMDLIMPHKDGVTATIELHEKAPTVKVIVLTSFGTFDDISHALDAGACGAVLKTANDNELVTAIRKVASGGRFISSQIKQMLQQSPPLPILTERQQYIVSSIARGLTNDDIAKQLGISPTVVREHITTILAKVGAANRAEAVAIALRKHLLKI